MANIWDEFDKSIDTEGLAKDVKEAAENSGGGNYKEVPHGDYEVAITKLELTKAKSSGNPMVSCWMKIVDGDFKNSMLFMNQVINQGFQIHIVNEFLRSLVSELKVKDAINIKFKTYKQYNNLLMDIAEAIDNNFEYLVEYGDNKGFSTYKVKEVYPLED